MFRAVTRQQGGVCEQHPFHSALCPFSLGKNSRADVSSSTGRVGALSCLRGSVCRCLLQHQPNTLTTFSEYLRRLCSTFSVSETSKLFVASAEKLLRQLLKVWAFASCLCDQKGQSSLKHLQPHPCGSTNAKTWTETESNYHRDCDLTVRFTCAERQHPLDLRETPPENIHCVRLRSHLF